MKSPSEAPPSGGRPWMGLLITAFILSCWIQPTSQVASVTVLPNLPFGKVGSNITLSIQGFSGEVLSYSWFRKSTEASNRIVSYSVTSGVQTPADIREKVLPNGSLLIPNLTLNDTDDYFVQIVDSYGLPAAEGRGRLNVYGPLPKPTINSTNMAPVENKDTVSLTCQTESQDVTYLWFINQSSPARDRIALSSDNRTLTITNVTRKDQGPYQCEIRNPVSLNMSDPFTLNVTYGPDTPTIFSTASHYPVGATLELNCSADSNPPAQYTWLVNGTQMMSTPLLTIPNVSLNDTGTYTCSASNSVTGLSRTKDINITISEKLPKPNITANLTNIIENCTLFFECNTEYDGTTILWLLNNQPLLLNERRNMSEDNRTLTINIVKREDAGSYECEIKNPISQNKSDPLNLIVNYGPDNIRFFPMPVREEIEVQLKSSLTLQCRVDSYPPAQYKWQVNGTMNSVLSSDTYNITSASWEHSGKYTCWADNNVTNLTVSKDVTIKVVEEKSTSGNNGSSLSGGAIAGIVIGVLAGAALIGGLIYFLFFRKSEGASEHHLTEHKSSASNHSQTFSDSSPNRTEEVSYASVNFNAQKPPAMPQPPTPTETVYSEIKKK